MTNVMIVIKKSKITGARKYPVAWDVLVGGPEACKMKADVENNMAHANNTINIPHLCRDQAL